MLTVHLIAADGNRSAVSDVGVAIGLLEAAAAGAVRSVHDLALITNDDGAIADHFAVFPSEFLRLGNGEIAIMPDDFDWTAISLGWKFSQR